MHKKLVKLLSIVLAAVMVVTSVDMPVFATGLSDETIVEAPADEVLSTEEIGEFPDDGIDVSGAEADIPDVSEGDEEILSEEEEEIEITLPEITDEEDVSGDDADTPEANEFEKEAEYVTLIVNGETASLSDYFTFDTTKIAADGRILDNEYVVTFSLKDGSIEKTGKTMFRSLKFENEETELKDMPIWNGNCALDAMYLDYSVTMYLTTSNPFINIVCPDYIGSSIDGNTYLEVSEGLAGSCALDGHNYMEVKKVGEDIAFKLTDKAMFGKPILQHVGYMLGEVNRDNYDTKTVYDIVGPDADGYYYIPGKDVGNQDISVKVETRDYNENAMVQFVNMSAFHVTLTGFMLPTYSDWCTISECGTSYTINYDESDELGTEGEHLLKVKADIAEGYEFAAFGASDANDYGVVYTDDTETVIDYFYINLDSVPYVYGVYGVTISTKKPESVEVKLISDGPMEQVYIYAPDDWFCAERIYEGEKVTRIYYVDADPEKPYLFKICESDFGILKKAVVTSGKKKTTLSTLKTDELGDKYIEYSTEKLTGPLTIEAYSIPCASVGFTNNENSDAGFDKFKISKAVYRDNKKEKSLPSIVRSGGVFYKLPISGEGGLIKLTAASAKTALVNVLDNDILIEAGKDNTITIDTSKIQLEKNYYSFHVYSVNNTVHYDVFNVGAEGESIEDTVIDPGNVHPGDAVAISLRNGCGTRISIEGAQIKYPGSKNWEDLSVVDASGFGLDCLVAGLMIDDKYAGKTITIRTKSVLTNMQYDSGITLKVKPHITGLTLSGAKKDKNGLQTVTQEKGTVATYTVKFKSGEADSHDALKLLRYGIEAAWTGNDYSQIAVYMPDDTEEGAELIIENTNTRKVVAEIYIKAKNPSWTSATPGVSVAYTTNTKISLKLTPPKSIVGKAAETGDFQYKIDFKLKGDPDVIVPSGYDLKDEQTIYVGAGALWDDDGDQTKYVDFYAFGNTKQPISGADSAYGYTYDSDFVEDTFESGGKINYDITVSIVKFRDDIDSVTWADNFINSSKIKKITASTKDISFGYKVKLEKKTTTVYAGQETVVARVDLGKNATFYRTMYGGWKVESVKRPWGEVIDLSRYELDYIEFSQKPDEAGCYNLLSVKASSDCPDGAYTVTVSTADGYTSKASITVNVVHPINNININVVGTDRVYKPANKAVTIKTSVSASSGMYEVKNPKVKYHVAYYDREKGKVDYSSLDNIKGITVNQKNGTVTVSKDYKPLFGKRTIVIIVQADDCPGVYNDPIEARVLVDIVEEEPLDFKYLEVYDLNTGEKFSTSAQIPYDKLKSAELELRLLDKDKKLVMSSKYADFGKYCYISSSMTGKTPTKPGKVTLTATGTDGRTAKYTVKYTYRSDSSRFDELWVGDDNQGFFMTDSSDDVLEERILHFNPNEPLLIAVTDYDQEHEYEYYPDSTLYNSYLTVTGAKVVEDFYGDYNSDKNQYLNIKLTSPKATIKLYHLNAKGKKVYDKTWTITSSTMASAPAAPKISSVSIVNHDGNEESLQGGKMYDERYDKIKITLKTPLKNARGEVIPAENVQAYVHTDMYFELCEAPYYEITEVNGKQTAVITASLNKDIYHEAYSKGLFEVSYEENYSDGSYKCATKGYSKIDLKLKSYDRKAKLSSTQTINYDPVSGNGSGKLKVEGTNVSKVDIGGILSVNNKGTYNDFSSVFEREDADEFVVSNREEGKYMDILQAEASKNKNKLPNSRTGYIKYTVTYTDGTTATFTEKVTIKFVKAK